MGEPQLKPVLVTPLDGFWMQYLPHFLVQKVPIVHRRLDDILVNRSIDLLAIEMARGMAKTRKASIGYPLYETCLGSYEDINIISRSGGTATSTAGKIMRTIKRELETNIPLINEFQLRKGSIWGQEAIEVIRGTGEDEHRITIYSYGKHGSIRGARGPVIIDDPQNRADVRSATVIAADEDWFFEDILPIVLEGQRLIFIGTTMSPLSLLYKVKALPEFTVFEFPVDDPPGSFRSMWPEHYSDEFLRKRCSIMGLDRFNSEYRCKARVSENPVFNENDFRYYEPKSEEFKKIVRQGLFKVTAGDGAYSKKKAADSTAIVTLGATMSDGKTDKKPQIYVLDVQHAQWSVKQAAEKIITTVYETWQQNITFIESICSPPDKDAWVEEIQEREIFYNCSVNLRWKKPTTDKLNRAFMAQSPFMEHRVFFDRTDRNQRELINQLIMFTGEETFPDDLVDAIVYAIMAINEWAKLGISDKGVTTVLPNGKRNPLTGYV